MGKYNVNELYLELDQNREHYKKWYVHLNPINDASPNELFKRKDTVAEIRILSFYKDETVTHNSCEYYVYYYPRHDKGLCETIFEGVKNSYATYEDAIADHSAIYEVCVDALKQYLAKL